MEKVYKIVGQLLICSVETCSYYGAGGSLLRPIIQNFVQVKIPLILSDQFSLSVQDKHIHLQQQLAPGTMPGIICPISVNITTACAPASPPAQKKKDVAFL